MTLPLNDPLVHPRASDRRPRRWGVRALVVALALLVPAGIAAIVMNGDAEGKTTPPTAAFEATCDGLSCAFDATASVAAEGEITAYRWDLGDGAIAASGPLVLHAYEAEGARTVTLTVWDEDGANASVALRVDVRALAPAVAPPGPGDAGEDDASGTDDPKHPDGAPGEDGQPPRAKPDASFGVACTNLRCTFDARGVMSRNGAIAGWHWDLGDGVFLTEGPVARFEFPAAGERTVRLTVWDETGAISTSVVSLALEEGRRDAPLADFVVTCERTTCAFAASPTPSGARIVSYRWELGSGAVQTAGPAIGHSFGDAGPKTVTLVVMDEQGRSATLVRTIGV